MSVIDPAIIAEIKALDPDSGDEIFKQLVEVFFRDSAQRSDLLKKAIDSGNWKEVMAQAHSLKSSCANVGALELSKLCRQIEDVVRIQKNDEVPGLLKAFSGALDAACAELKGLI